MTNYDSITQYQLVQSVSAQLIIKLSKPDNLWAHCFNNYFLSIDWLIACKIILI